MDIIKVSAFCASILALNAASVGNAETLEESAARYGHRSSILDISLSPNGDKIAFIAPGPQHTEVLQVVDLATGGEIKRIASNTDQHTDFSRCEWATNTRLICELEGTVLTDNSTLIGMSRLFAISDDGSDPEVLTENRGFRALGIRQDGGTIVALDVPGEENRILMTKQYVPERTIGTRLANEDSGLGVDSVDILKGRRRVAERADKDASRYVADETGAIRLKTRSLSDGRGVLTGERVHMYRAAGSDNWMRLDTLIGEGEQAEDFYPVAVDAGRDMIYGFVGSNGYDAVAEVALGGDGTIRQIVARDDVDVDRLIRIGRQRRVVGASYATEKRQVEYFDPALEKLASSLTKALPGNPLINFVGASADESKLLIIASRDTDPGMVYLFDRSTNALEPLLAMRDYLVDQPMGQMTPVSFPAADGTQIPGYLTLPPGSDGKNLPAIVLPHGGPSARDEWGFDWLVQFFVARGYAVLQPNYRGSSGYGRAWFGKNGFKAWRTAIGDVNDAGRWLVDQGIAKPDKLAIVGWSYGGYAALQSQVVDPDLYGAVVAIAPVVDLEMLRDDARPYTNFRIVDRFIGSGPHVGEGSPARHAESFKSPVMLFHGTLDQNVDVRHSRVMQDRLEDAGKTVAYSEYEGLEHSLADSAARAEMLTKIDKFLAESLAQ